MTSEEYGQLIDDFELGADVGPDETLTQYIERRRREFESKADGGSIGIEVFFKEKMANGGRVPAVSGGFLKLLAEGAAKGKQGIMELIETGKGKFDDFVETQANKKIYDVENFKPTVYPKSGPMTIEAMEAVDPSIVKRVLRSQELGLYEETPEILKAANLLERFTKKIKGKRVIDYERAEAILGVPLKGDETINDLFRIEFETRPVEKLADGGRVGLFMGGDPLTGQALQIYNSMKGYNFSDQEIADALSARGLYTAADSGTTQPEQVTGIINQQIQTGGGRDDNLTGFGKFGNLDPTTEKEATVNFYDEEYGDFVPTKTKVYQNTKSGLFQTIDGKNAFPAFSNKGQAFGLSGIVLNALGLEPDTVGGYVPGSIQGKYDGIGDMFSNIKNPFNLFKKQQATVADINAMNKKAYDDLQAKLAAEKAAADAARAAEMARYNITSGSDFTGGTPGGGGGNVKTTGGDVYGGATRGGYNEAAEKTDYYRDGGLATMFTRRR